MRAIKVNADYEEVLRTGREKAQLNSAIEFLAFWIQEQPVLCHRSYPPEYLQEIRRYTGTRPSLVYQGEYSNWWGELINVPLERTLNSKTWARRYWQHHWNLPGKIITHEEDAERLLSQGGEWLAKRSLGMSGRGHWKLNAINWQSSRERLKSWWADEVLLEPLYQRVSDLSALWLPQEERFIFYRNQIDDRFQWRGCVLENGGMPQWNAEEAKLVALWHPPLKSLALELRTLGYFGVFSVDAFFYRDGSQLQLMPCSEINARKTMGWIAHELWKRDRPSWCRLGLSDQGLSLAPADALFQWRWETKN